MSVLFFLVGNWTLILVLIRTKQECQILPLFVFFEDSARGLHSTLNLFTSWGPVVINF